MRRNNMQINSSLHIEEQNEHNLIHRVCPMDFLIGDYEAFQCMLSYFAAGLKRWIQLSPPVIMLPIVFGLSSILLCHLQQISMRQSLYPRVRKWETSKLQPSSFSTSCAELYRQTILKYPELEQVVEQWCDNLLEVRLWMYLSSPLRNCLMIV